MSATFSIGGYQVCEKWLKDRKGRTLTKDDRAEHDALVALVALVDRTLKAKRSDEAADTAALEREIDERVYRLYGLTAEEIKIVEESSK